MHSVSAKKLCRAGIVAAMYVALTLVCAPLAFGPVQIRPGEALTALPLLFSESVPALFVGCLIANLLSPYGVWDVVIGSLTTLLAAALTRLTRKKPILAMNFPVTLNAIFLPLMWKFAAGDAAFWMNFLSLFLTQAIFCYGLGLPLYFGLRKAKETARFLQD